MRVPLSLPKNRSFQSRERSYHHSYHISAPRDAPAGLESPDTSAFSKLRIRNNQEPRGRTLGPASARRRATTRSWPRRHLRGHHFQSCAKVASIVHATRSLRVRSVLSSSSCCSWISLRKSTAGHAPAWGAIRAKLRPPESPLSFSSTCHVWSNPTTDSCRSSSASVFMRPISQTVQPRAWCRWRCPIVRRPLPSLSFAAEAAFVPVCWAGCWAGILPMSGDASKPLPVAATVPAHTTRRSRAFAVVH